MYDYLIVGAGLYGACFARLATDAGKRCLILERRPHIAGNVYSEQIAGVEVHRYGAHIFHTNNDAVWQFVNRFAEFNNFVNSPIANYKGQLFNLPFNMNTFYQMWQVVTPEEAKNKIAEQQAEADLADKEPQNLAEQAMKLVGKDIFEKLIAGYTEKQWGRKCSELPASIIKRLPVRFTYDNNYFNAKYQGIPKQGYTQLVEQMLAGVDVKLEVDFLADKNHWQKQAKEVIYTGQIDEYFAYQLGALAYRNVHFDTKVLPRGNYQGVAVMNFTDRETPYTRIIEHKHFALDQLDLPQTVISYEYSAEWKPGEEAYYPVCDQTNNELYQAYCQLAKKESQLHFGGRLGTYRYYDMDKIIEQAMRDFHEWNR